MNVRSEFLNILQSYIDFPVEELPTDEGFKASSGIDSFTLIELIAETEEKFSLSIPNTALMQFRTINDIIGYIESNIKP